MKAKFDPAVHDDNPPMDAAFMAGMKPSRRGRSKGPGDVADRAASHRKRFANWSKLGGEPLTSLARLIDEQLIPAYRDAGFERVSFHWHDPTYPVSGSDICLERSSSGDIEAVTFNFDKYHRPAFQIHLNRRKADHPNEWVRSANIVLKPSEYYRVWGKPWWLPKAFWSSRMSGYTISRIRRLTGTALAFLETGERGYNISRQIPFTAQVSLNKAAEMPGSELR